MARPGTFTVNGVEIARAAIARETQNYPAAKPIEAWLSAARALVGRELLLQEARRLAVACVPMSDDDGRRETDGEVLNEGGVGHNLPSRIDFSAYNWIY